MRKYQIALKYLMPTTITLMLLLFIAATASFIARNCYFIEDDFNHIADAKSHPLLELMATPIDVHFVPLHQLLTFLVTRLAPLNFNLALGVMIVSWGAILLLVHRLLRQLTSSQAAWIITLLLGASPVWLHIFVWWSAAVHRFPYLLLQAVAFFSYLRYREHGNINYAILCTASQILALGFFTKAILFPLVLAAFELCLAFEKGRASRSGIKLCFFMAIISTVYGAWYLIFAPVLRMPSESTLGVIDTLRIAPLFLSRLGSLLLFLPIDQHWAAWISGPFWLSLATYTIWLRPRSALPIGILLALLQLSFILTLAGRGWLAAFPLAAMRYYSEEAVVIAVFTALALSKLPPQSEQSKWQTVTIAFSLLLVLSYPVATYYSDRSLFTKVYDNTQRTHDFIKKLRRSLDELAEQEPHAKIASTDLPPFAYGFLGLRMPVGNAFGQLYPGFEWIKPELVRGKIFHIKDNGQIEPLVLPDETGFQADLSFPDWNPAEATLRWNKDHHATLIFSTQATRTYDGILSIKGVVLGNQRLTVRLNNQDIAKTTLRDSDTEWDIHFSPDILINNGVNAFEFEMPDAHAGGDSRILAIGIKHFRVH